MNERGGCGMEAVFQLVLGFDGAVVRCLFVRHGYLYVPLPYFVPR
jgi:hypothetical protein